MEQHDSNLDSLHNDLANRFKVLGQFFNNLSSPEATQELLNSLVSEDAKAFSALTDAIDIPMIGKCFWVREIIERVVATPVGYVQVCRLRDDLTSDERLLYIRIALRHNQATPSIATTNVLEVVNNGGPIPQGPFLDELIANNLVTCNIQMQYETSVVIGFSKPSRVCV